MIFSSNYMPRRAAALVVFASLLAAGPLAAQPDQAPPPVRVKPMGLTPFQLDVWNSEGFQRRLVESFVSETDIEPSTITEEERDVLIQVRGLIGEDKALEAYNLLEESKNDTSTPLYYFTTGTLLLQHDELARAAADYEVAIERFGNFRRAWRNLGLVRVRQGEFGKAREAFAKVIKLGGADADTFGLLGYCYSSVNNPLSAESAYRMANLLDPDELNWKMGLARSFFRQQRYSDAAALCGQLLEADAGNADLWLLQANAYIGLREPQKAAENYLIVDGLGKSTVASLNTLGDIYTNDGLYDVAVDVYVRAMAMAQEDAEAQQVMTRVLRAARVLSGQNATEETKTLIAQIQELQGERLTDEQEVELLKLRSRIAVAEGAGDEEVQLLKQIVELDPLDGEALLLLGQNSAREQHYEQAVFYYERAAKVEAYEADAKVRHAQTLVALGDYKQALSLLRSAQNIKFRETIQTYIEQIERVSKSS